jgi:hypothetical protein
MVLIALLLTLVIGDMLAWHFAVRQLRSGLADWVDARRVAGWSVNAARPETGGWPLAATLTLRNVALQGGAPDIPDGIAWRSESVVLRLALLHPLELRIETSGAQQLRVADAPDIPFTAGQLHLLVPLRADPATQAFRLHGEALRAGLLVAGADDALTIDRLDMDALVHPAAAQGQPAMSVTVKGDGVGLPSRLHWPLGPRIASVILEAAMNSPLRDVAGLAAVAKAWRDDGGSLDVQHVETHWGPLRLTATATLALDAELQPMGTGTAQVTGYAETLDALARNGLMSRSAATTAKAVLSLLANAPDDGSASEVEVPLSLQYRTLSMRQVPLVRLPELDWPQQ